ncbi:MAG: zinc-binding dehydrogenase [Methylotenera sp.]|nr:zinc-binding dehydrogenase [Oligoflexia bacterium]
MAKAIYWVKKGKSETAFELRESPGIESQVPPEGHVRIRVQFSGLNFADVMARLGLYPEAPRMPSVLGYDVVGIVEAVGDSFGAEVTHLKVGDRVVAMTRFGGYSSYVVTPALAAAVIPADMDGAKATALATQYCTAYFAAYEMIRLHAGDHVLVQAAAGGVGTALVQMAKLQGCTVYGTTGSASKRDYLKKLGVDHVIIANPASGIRAMEGDLGEQVLKLSDGRKMDAIFDSLGGKAVYEGWKLLAAGGRIACFGAADFAGTKNPFKALRTLTGFGIYHPLKLMMNSKGMIGINMLAVSDTRQDIIQRCLAEVVKLVAAGKLDPHVGAVFPAEKIGEAHEFLGARKSTGKVVLSWS